MKYQTTIVKSFFTVFILTFIEGVSKQAHPLFNAQSPDFPKPGLCYFLKFSYL